MLLFTEPFDLDKIELALSDDDFLSLAHCMVGREENWRDGLDQVVRLIPLFESAGRQPDPIYGMASILINRTGQLREPNKRLEEATTKLGLLPRTRSQ